MATVQPEMRRGGSPWRASNLALVVVLAAAAVGAISLVRQRAAVPPPPIPPPAWALEGHDAARTGHSLSQPAGLPITLVWWRVIEPSRSRPMRAPIIDGIAGGTVYIAQPEGSLLALDSAGNTLWCTALQPITDTNCTSAPAPPPPAPLPAPVLPNAMIGPDGNLYVVGEKGVVRAFDRSSPQPLMHGFVGFVPDDGVVFGPDPGVMYGVVPMPPVHGLPAFAVAAARWKGAVVRGWQRTLIPSRGLAPLTIAPDGSVLAAATAPRSGGNAALYALDKTGRIRWRVRLAPGRPSDVSVEGPGDDWVAWVAIAGARRSWVVVVDRQGHTLWRWSTGRMLTVSAGGVALAHPRSPDPLRSGLAYVGSSIGVYGLDLRRHKAWLFFNTRNLGATGAPITDVADTVYVATENGWVFDVWPSGRVRWQYNTRRTSPGPLALYPDGSVFVTTRDSVGAVVAERLGVGGTSLATPTTMYCAGPDCPTLTPAPSPTIAANGAAAFTATVTGTVTTTAPLPATVTTTAPAGASVPIPTSTAPAG